MRIRRQETSGGGTVLVYYLSNISVPGYTDKIKLPEDLSFIDYSGLDVRAGQRAERGVNITACMPLARGGTLQLCPELGPFLGTIVGSQMKQSPAAWTGRSPPQQSVQFSFRVL